MPKVSNGRGWWSIIFIEILFLFQAIGNKAAGHIKTYKVSCQGPFQNVIVKLTQASGDADLFASFKPPKIVGKACSECELCQSRNEPWRRSYERCDISCNDTSFYVSAYAEHAYRDAIIEISFS